MESTKNILVTGSNGQLGCEFRAIADQFPQFNFDFTGRMDLDITLESRVKDYILKHKPDAVINCAAYTNVEKSEEDIEDAELGNTFSPGFIAKACHEAESLLVHYSTDYVFDGLKGSPYSEEDQPAPLSQYGRTKLEGERLIDEIHKRAFVIRTSWVYSTFGHNFYKTMLRLARERGELKVVSDQFASPTYARSLAMDTLRLLDKSLVRREHVDYGLYHYTQDGVASWADFAKEIMTQSKMDVPVHKVLSTEFPMKAKRPAYSKLDNSKFKKNTGIIPLTWQEGLAECIRISQTNL
jgi:dTDP-4-dehydrorhamnose reductase